jgi:hypothetical protein
MHCKSLTTALYRFLTVLNLGNPISVKDGLEIDNILFNLNIS